MTKLGRRLDTSHHDAVRDLAAKGMSQSQIAKMILKHPSWVSLTVKRLGLKVRDARGDHRRQTHDVGRATAIAARYADGQTLQQIAADYGITRERIRQIIRDQTDLNPKDGGQSVRTKRVRELRATKRDQIYMGRLGCGWEEFKKIRDLGRSMVRRGRGEMQTPLRAFCAQKTNAARRSIGWEFSFWEWWSVWQASGRWEQRGRGQGYVMCRRNDEGPYAPGNVFITTAIENTSSSKHKKSGLPTGVTRRGNRFEANRTIRGQRRSLGTFGTATEAYAAYVAAAPGFVPAKGKSRGAESRA